MAADSQLALAAVLTSVVVLGVLGNIAVVISLCRTRNLLKSNHYYLLLHLAICDLLYLIFFMEVICGIFKDDSAWMTSISYFLCKLLWPAQTFVFTAAPNFLILISIIRYRSMVQPLKPAISRRTLKVLSTAVWVLAIIWTIPYVVVLKFDKTSGCDEEWPLESLNYSYTVFLASVQYFIPATILSIIYFKICKKLIEQNKIKIMNTCNQLQQQNVRAPTCFQSLRFRNTKTFLVVFVIVTCFIVCAGPLQVTMIVSVMSSKELPSYDSWLYVPYMLGTVVLNPFLYGALDRKVFSFFTHLRKKMRDNNIR